MMTSQGSSPNSRLTAAAIAAPLAVFAIALVARLIGLHHTPYVDELNHVMAAHALLARGYLKLIVCHLNHHLRGRNSNADARFVANLAKKDELKIKNEK